VLWVGRLSALAGLVGRGIGRAHRGCGNAGFRFIRRAVQLTRPRRADDGTAVGEDAYDVGAAPDLFVESLLGIVGPDLAPDLFGKAVKASRSVRAASRCSATLGSLSLRASRTRSYWATTDQRLAGQRGSAAGYTPRATTTPG
jgi:hypothetical protein